MKKITLITFLVAFFFVGIQAQDMEVPETQKPLIVKIAASWCPPCGGWGWDFFDDIYDDNEDSAIFLSVHHSGDHTNTAASEITGNFNVFGQPRFIFDGVDQNVSSSNASSKRGDIENMVEGSTSSDPVIQTGIDASYNGDNMSVSYSTELFQDLSGDYSVALYLVEKIHVGYQASIGNDAQHKDLLRMELSDNTFGTMLFSGSASAGSVYNGSFDIPLGQYDPENLEIVSVVWKKQGNNYLVVNSNVDDEVEEQITSDVSNLSDVMVLEVFPTVVDDHFKISIKQNTAQEDISLSLYDQFGRKLTSIQNASTLGKGQDIVITRRNEWISGVYYLISKSGEHINTHKLIFE